MKLLSFSLTVVLLSVLGCASKTATTISSPPSYSAAGTAVATTPAPPLIPMRDFFRNPERSRFNLSQDGKSIAYLAPYQNRMNIFVVSTAELLANPGAVDSKSRRITSVTDRDIHGFFWKGNTTILYSKDSGGDENFHITAVDTKTAKSVDLTPFPKVKARITDDLYDSSRDEVLVELNRRNPEVFDVYRLNVRTKKLRLIAENPGNITGWLPDHLGRVRFAVASDGQFTQLFYRDTESQPFTPGLRFDFRTSISPFFFSFDNKTIYGASDMNRERQAIVRFDPKTGQELEVLYEHPEVDVGGLYYSRKRKVLTAASYVTWKHDFQFFDDTAKNRYNRLTTKLPNQAVFLVSTTKAEDKFIVFANSDRSRGSFYFYDDAADSLTKLVDTAPWLAKEWLAEMRPVTYKSRDGQGINAYLTLPLGKEPRNLPVVINPHGGPWHRDEWEFNPEAQFLANRGYAVLQPNFRGSTGYGRKFWELSFKQWGKTMQDDVTDGVQWLIKEGIADPKRVAIYGGSYGGYATLAGLTFTPDLYACGIDYVGVSNLFTFLKSIPPYWKPMLEKLYTMVGHPEQDAELLKAASPVFHVDKIKAPLLVAQGAKDPRVNKNESDQIVDALRKRGIDVAYLVKENEGHGFHNEENRFEFYEAMENFLKKHLGSGRKAD